jgi:hypothetical protein
LAAESLLIKGKAEAKKDGKQIFLLFTAPESEWCERLDQFHADLEVSRIMQKHFTLVRVDIEGTPGGEQMYQEYGANRGVPAFSLLDHHGMTLSHSGSDEVENFGFPTDAAQIESYFACLRAACPNLTDEEAAVLRAKLEEMQPSEPITN